MFAQKNVRIENCRVFGKNRNVVKMKLYDENGCEAEGVWFGDGDAFAERIKEKNRWSVAYYPSINPIMAGKVLKLSYKIIFDSDKKR